MKELNKESSGEDVCEYIRWINKNIIQKNTNYRLIEYRLEKMD